MNDLEMFIFLLLDNIRCYKSDCKDPEPLEKLESAIIEARKDLWPYEYKWSKKEE